MSIFFCETQRLKSWYWRWIIVKGLSGHRNCFSKGWTWGKNHQMWKKKGKWKTLGSIWVWKNSNDTRECNQCRSLAKHEAHFIKLVKLTMPHMEWNAWGVYVHSWPLAVRELMIYNEHIQIRASDSHWTVPTIAFLYQGTIKHCLKAFWRTAQSLKDTNQSHQF